LLTDNLHSTAHIGATSFACSLQFHCLLLRY